MYPAAKHASGTAQAFAEHLYCWLRNGHNRPHIDSVLNMVSQPFHLTPNEIVAYEFAKDGSISRRTLPKDPFKPGVTAESQTSAVADTRINGGITPIIMFKNNVRNLGTTYGGKHAGRPLIATALDWSTYDFGGSLTQAVGIDIGGTNLSTAYVDVRRMRRVGR